MGEEAHMFCQALPRPTWYMVLRSLAASPTPAHAARQGLTLVHFSAQPEPFLTPKAHPTHPLTPPDK